MTRLTVPNLKFKLLIRQTNRVATTKLTSISIQRQNLEPGFDLNFSELEPKKDNNNNLNNNEQAPRVLVLDPLSQLCLGFSLLHFTHRPLSLALSFSLSL